MSKKRIKVLMIGPNRNDKGGITSVVNQYYCGGLQDIVDLEYLDTTINGNPFKKLLWYLICVVKSFRLINKSQIVHIHMSKNGSFYRKRVFINIAKKHNKRVVLHIHTSQFNEFYSNSCSFIKKMIRNAFNKVDKTIVLSEFWKQQISKLSEKSKIRIISNGVNLPAQYIKDYSNSNILFLGKVCKEKGIYDLLKAMPNIIKNEREVILYVGGLGEIENCKQVCNQLNIDQSVKFLGWLNEEEKSKYLKISSVFILPSYSEGMPVSLIEAMSYGTACVASNVGGVPEVIVNQKNGTIIPEGSIESIEASLLYYLQNTEIKKIVGNNAFLTIKDKYNIQKVINELIELYDNLLN